MLDIFESAIPHTKDNIGRQLDIESTQPLSELIDVARNRMRDSLWSKPAQERNRKVELLTSYLGDPNASGLGHYSPLMNMPPYREHIWLTDNPRGVFLKKGVPIEQAVHTMPSDVFLRIVLQNDEIRSGHRVLSTHDNDRVQTRLGPRQGIHEILTRLCPSIYHEKSAMVWLYPQGATLQEDVLRNKRELMKPERWRNAEAECRELANTLLLIGKNMLSCTDESWSRLPSQIHRATGNMFSYLTEPINVMVKLLEDCKDMNETKTAYFLIETLGQRMVNYLNSYYSRNDEDIIDEAPEDLGIVSLSVNIGDVMDRVLTEAGLYPVVPSDRATDLLLSAPNVQIDEVTKVECDRSVYDFLKSDSPIATRILALVKQKGIELALFPEQEVPKQELINSSEVPPTTGIDIFNPSCSVAYRVPEVAQKQWSDIARNCLIAPAYRKELSAVSTRDYIASIFGPFYSESGLGMGVYELLGVLDDM